MEKYEIVKLIGHGMLATVYKAKNKESKDNKDLVLKEVECLDLTRAQNALDEYRVFHSIKHRYITNLIDSCIKWDKKTSSVYICYIMEYFSKGDLMTYLNESRSKKVKIPYEKMRIWSAEIVEGLEYLHRNGLLHRNMKPSSLYLYGQSNNDSPKLMIGDFGINTVIKDARTKTRIVSGAFSYAAPEIIDSQEFDTKSDIWAVGTTLLDMCTCSLYDLKNFQSILLNIRHDDGLMDQVLEDIYKCYEAKDLVRVLEKMLMKNRSERINMKRLINEDFIFEGLHQINSDLVRNYGSNNIKTLDGFPKEGNQKVDALMKLIQSRMENEQEVQSAIVTLGKLVKDIEYNLLASLNYQECLANVMKHYANNELIQVTILKIIKHSVRLQLTKTRHTINDATPLTPLKFGSNLYSKLLENFIFIHLKHEHVEEIQLNSIKLLIELSNYVDVSDKLASYDIIGHLIDSLKNFKSNGIISGYACKAIWCLSIHDSIFRTHFKHEFLKHIKHVLLKFRDDKFCIEMACNVIMTLCMNERLIEREEISVDSTSAILIGLQRHVDSSNLVRSALMALASLISFSEECAFRFLYVAAEHNETDKDIDGIGLLSDIYTRHKDESEIVSLICSLLQELCKYDEMVVELRSLKLNESLVNDISKRFRDNLTISQTCEHVTMKIDVLSKRKSQFKTFDDSAINKQQTV